MSFLEEDALRTSHRPFIHPTPVVMFTFSSKVNPAIWWNIVSQCIVHIHGQGSYENIFLKVWFMNAIKLRRNNYQRRARRALSESKCMERVISCLGINQQDQRFKFTWVSHQSSNIVHRRTGQKAELEKYILTFAFALAYAAAHAGPKSEISEEPTYENMCQFQQKSKSKPWITHRRGLTGVDNGVIWGYWVIWRYWEGRKGGRLYWDIYLSLRGRARRGRS